MTQMLDETRAYSCEWGIGGAQAYEQDGHKFNNRKEMIVPKKPDTPQAYADMHWSKLKQLVEEKGEVWIDKETAIKFLNG